MGQRVDRIGTIGIVGGGQLARMTALAARRLGYATHVLAAAEDCPAGPVVERVHVGDIMCADHVAALARECDVLTIDGEHVSGEGLARAAAFAAVRPGAAVLATVQDRRLQKRWLADRGFQVGAFREVRDQQGLAHALGELGGPLHVKRARGGYDGRGQHTYEGAGEGAPDVVRQLGTTELVVEAHVPFVRELSVLVARGVDGASTVYPPALNHHEHGVLAWSSLPAPIEDELARRAQRLAREIAEALEVVGLLCVELFQLADGRLLVNELAPRPHNSYHASERACETSQFEQLVRAVVGLPLGPVRAERAAAMYNLFGDLWLGAAAPDIFRALGDPAVSVHLYGKLEPRTGRKMGHLLASASTAQQALARVMQARDDALAASRDDQGASVMRSVAAPISVGSMPSTKSV